MDSSATVVGLQAARGALSVITALGLTGYLWPPQATVGNGTTVDYIVVGAGTAGCIVANRLTEMEGINVLLIEAGGDPPFETTKPSIFPTLQYSINDWNFTTVNDGVVGKHQRGPSIYFSAGKMLGGSSSLHHLLYLRGAPHDYNSWASLVQDEQWNYENLLPYFKKSERLEAEEVLQSETAKYHGTEGPLKVTTQRSEVMRPYLEALAEIGHRVTLDVNGANPIGFSEPMLTIGDELRQSSATAFLTPIKDRENLKVLKNTLVTKIIFDSHNKAVGVEALSADGELLEFRAGVEVIISAGALKTPQLLMLSGVGPKAHLESLNIPVISDVPVGKNLQDHVSVIQAHKTTAAIVPAPPQNPGNFPVPSVMGFVSLNKSQDYPDYQVMSFVMPHDTPVVIQFCALIFGMVDEVCQKIYDAGKGRELLFTIHNNLHPLSRGDVTLNSVNPEDAPVINHGFLSNPEDLENEAKFVADFNEIANSSFFKSINAELVDLDFEACRGLDRNSQEFYKCYTLETSGTTYHYVGTCALGSVVDSDLRVKGVTGLRLADASVIPLVTSGNIISAVMAVAEKAVDLIKDQNGPRS